MSMHPRWHWMIVGFSAAYGIHWAITGDAWMVLCNAIVGAFNLTRALQAERRA